MTSATVVHEGTKGTKGTKDVCHSSARGHESTKTRKTPTMSAIRKSHGTHKPGTVHRLCVPPLFLIAARSTGRSRARRVVKASRQRRLVTFFHWRPGRTPREMTLH